MHKNVQKPSEPVIATATEGFYIVAIKYLAQLQIPTRAAILIIIRKITKRGDHHVRNQI